MSQTLITVAALLAAPAFAAKGSKGMGGMGHSHRHPNEVICATFDYANTTIDVVREDEEMFVRSPFSFFATDLGFTGIHLDLSADCQRGTIYKSIWLTYNPMGHPPFDFYGGGYGVPHWDAHFFTITRADSDAGGAHDMTSCVSTQVPVQCDPESTDPRNVKFFAAPSAEFVPEGFQQDTQFGGHAIIDHGNHWLSTIEMAPGGPGFHTINGNAPVAGAPGPPSWVQCAMQAPTADGQVDNGCRFGYWSGFSSVLITHDGTVIGHEPMFTSSVVTRLAQSVSGGSVVRIVREYPQAQRFQQSGMSAQQIFISVESYEDMAEPLVRVGLVLGTSGSSKSGGKGSGRTSTYAEALTAVASKEAFVPVVAASAVGLVAVVALLGYRARRTAGGYETLEHDESAETGSIPSMQ